MKGSFRVVRAPDRALEDLHRRRRSAFHEALATVTRGALAWITPAVLATLALAGCGASDEPTTAAWPAGEPAWVIQAQDTSGASIQLVDAEGAVVRTVAPDIAGGDRNNPDWSPDGARLTFTVHGDQGKDDLWVANVDGGGARMVYDCTGACDYLDDPAWSPDGKTIAACMLSARSDDDHRGTLVGVDVATGRLTTLFTLADRLDFCSGPRWSPDGARIVVELVHRRDTSLDDNISGVTLSIVDPGASPATIRGLTDPKLFAATADWSPDGSTIVYSALPEAGGSNTDLFAVDPEGGDPQRLTTLAEDGGGAAEPAFDADGKSIVFVSSEPELSRVDADGGDVRAAFPTPVTGRHPRARPAPQQ